MPFPPSPMSLPQQPHGGGAKPPDPNAWVDKFMKKHPDAAKQHENSSTPEELIRKAKMSKLPKMPLPPPSVAIDEGGGRHLDFGLPNQGGVGWPPGSGPDDEPQQAGLLDGLGSEYWIPPISGSGGTLRAPSPWNYEWNPPTPSKLPQMPLPPVDPDKDTLYRGLMPPGERIWQDKPWT